LPPVVLPPVLEEKTVRARRALPLAGALAPGRHPGASRLPSALVAAVALAEV
jgi:hypothetical protein